MWNFPSITRRTVALTSLLLGACASWMPPAVDAPYTPAAWWQEGSGTATVEPAWWRAFDDAELDALVAAALAAAPDVRTAQARWRQVRAAHDLANAALWPTIGASGAITRTRPASASGGSGTANTVHSVGIDAAWEVPLLGGAQDAASAAGFDVRAASAQLAATQLSLAAETALDVIEWRGLQQRLATGRESAQRLAQTLQIVEWRQQAGLASALDVAQARTALAQAHAALPVLENGAAAAEHRLAVLTATAPALVAARLSRARSLPAVPSSLAAGLPADLLRRRPDVDAAEATLRAEWARTAAAAAGRQPAFRLNATLDWQALHAGELGAAGTLARSLAATLVGTLFDGGATNARLAMQEAVGESARVAYEQALATAIEDVENALAAGRTAANAAEFRAQALAAAGEAARLAQAQYHAGLIDFARVLDAERTRLTAADALVQAQVEHLATHVRMAKALGGGWQNDAVPDHDKEHP